MTMASRLLVWYQQNARQLPWRSVQSPYRTWISEVMLQQTQVERVIPYFENWMAHFPDVETLAEADLQDVLSLWEGLGYYRRARNLHSAAKMVVDFWGGKIPEKVSDLKKLPGIGDYTAAAIASMAFNQDVAAVDGNIRRVLSRYFDVRDPARSTEGEKKLWALAKANLPKGSAGDYNQALMDLGATICTPTQPNCPGCPILAGCLAYQLGVQAERPVKVKRKKIPHVTVTAAVIRRNGKVLLAQRPAKGLLGGLWEFPGGTMELEDQDLEACLIREIREELSVNLQIDDPFGEYQHAYTHFRISLHAFLGTIPEGEHPQALASDNLAWVGLDELDAFPMGKVDRLIAKRLIKEGSNGLVQN